MSGGASEWARRVRELRNEEGYQILSHKVKDKSKGRDDEPTNLRAVCTHCNEGLQNAALPKPDQVWLLSQIRRATIADQEVVLGWLLNKFNLISEKK